MTILEEERRISGVLLGGELIPISGRRQSLCVEVLVDGARMVDELLRNCRERIKFQ